MASKSHLSVCRTMYLSDKMLLLLVILLLLQCVELESHRLKRETRCSVYMDSSWQFKDEQCPKGKRYHCYENENDEIVDSGCFQLKDCLKGSHPIVEGETIVCGFCPTGFYQPLDYLKSNEYTYSYCNSHTAPCKPEYGQSLCQAGTRESDRTCTCNATLGYSPGTNTSECQLCFTPDSLCLACRFTGCPVGSVKTKRGFCEPEQKTTQVMVTSTPKQTISPAGEDNSLSPRAIVGIVLPLLVLVVAGLAVVLYCCYRKNLLCWKKPSVEEKKDPVSSFSGIPSTNTIENQTINIGRAGNVYFFGNSSQSEDRDQQKKNTPTREGGSNIPPQTANHASPAETNTRNGQLPSGTTADPSSPVDAAEAEKLSELGPEAANHEEAPPLLPTPTAPSLPLDPSAPPPSLPFEDRGQVEEVGEDAGDTFVKTPLPTAADEETQVKVPYSANDPTDETEMKTSLLSDDEETELKTTFSGGDFEDAASSENTNLKTPLLSEPEQKMFPSPRRETAGLTKMLGR